MELGTLYEGERVTLTESGEASGATLDCHIYRFDYNALAELRAAMVTEPMEITSFSDTHIEGTVTASEAGMLLTSIPYDKGWTVTADGRTLDTDEYFNAFLAVRLPAGTHQMTFDFRPRGRTEGILITIVSLILLLGAAAFSVIHKKRGAEETPEDEASEEDSEMFDGEDDPEECDSEEDDSGEDDSGEESEVGETFSEDGPEDSETFSEEENERKNDIQASADIIDENE